MDASGIAASIAQVDLMLDRVVKVIGRERPEKPLRPDVSYPRRAPKKVYRSEPQPMSRNATRDGQSVIASGQLAGNEMRMSGYSPQPARSEDCDPDGMWAAFESDFDDMVAGMK